MCKADREVRPIFFNKTHYLHCTKGMPKININLLSPSPTTFEYARKIHHKFVYFSNLKKKWLDCYSGFNI